MIKTGFPIFLRLPSVRPDSPLRTEPGHPPKIDALTTCAACRNRIDEPAPDDDDTPLACEQEGAQLLQAQRKRATVLQSPDEQSHPAAELVCKEKRNIEPRWSISPQQRIYPASIKESAPKSRFFKVCGSDLGFWVQQITPGSISKIGTTTGLERFPSAPHSEREKKTHLLLYLRFRVHGTTNAITTKSRPEAPHGGCRQRCPAIAEVVVVMAVSEQTQQRQRGPRASRDRPTTRTKLPLDDRHPDGRVVDAQRLRSAGQGRESETCRCRCVLSTKRTTPSDAHHRRGRP